MNSDYIGYIRVSSKEQNEARQIIALTEYGVLPDLIFCDKTSGKDFDRDNYKQMLKRLKKGKILVIKSIDRLGRNYEEIINQWRHITKEIGADIVVLDMPILDTRQFKDLLGTFISDLTLQLLSFVAENERTNIRQRQAEGIAAAKAKGVVFGRPPEFNSDDYTDIFRKYLNKEIKRQNAVCLIGCSTATFYRMMQEQREKGRL